MNNQMCFPRKNHLAKETIFGKPRRRKLNKILNRTELSFSGARRRKGIFVL